MIPGNKDETPLKVSKGDILFTKDKPIEPGSSFLIALNQGITA
jgi:hypothetical protein